MAHKFTFAALWPEYRAKNRSIVEIDDNFVFKEGFQVYRSEILEKYNEEALSVYQQVLPDYEVIPIEATIQTNAGGALNCSSKEIPDINRMKAET